MDDQTKINFTNLANMMEIQLNTRTLINIIYLILFYFIYVEKITVQDFESGLGKGQILKFHLYGNKIMSFFLIIEIK